MKTTRHSRVFSSVFLSYVVAIAFSLLCVSSFAQSDGVQKVSGRGYAGVLLGAGLINNSGGTNFTYGVGGGYKFGSNWSVGADLSYNTFTVPSPATAGLTLVLANFKHYFNSGFFGGLKLGSGTVSYSGSANLTSATNLAWGPTLGYDCALSSNWSVGGEANLTWLSNSNPGVSDLQILVNLKYWF